MEPKKRAAVIVISSDSEEDDRVVTRATPLGLEASRVSAAAGTKSERVLALASQPGGARGSKSALGLVQTTGVPFRPNSSPALVHAAAVKPPRAAIHSSRVAAVPSELWADSAAPMAPDDLAVHKAKVREVHEWLVTAVASAGEGKHHEVCQASPRLLVLLGPPGTGKSTTVNVLAKSMDLDVRQWSDAGDKGSGGWGGDSFFFNFMRPEVSGDSEHLPSRWVSRRGAGTAVANRGGEERAPSSRPPAYDDNGSGDLSSVLRKAYDSSVRSLEGGMDRIGGVHTTSGGTVMSDFRAFIGASALFPALVLAPPSAHHVRSTPSRSPMTQSTAAGTLPSAGGLLLIEDLPRPHNPGDTAFREELVGCFRYLLDHAPCPVVLVVSEGEESGDAPSLPALTRLLDASILQHPSTAVISFNPVANTLMGRCLQRIAVRNGMNQLTRPALDSIVHSARGDLRHAITSLQFLSTFAGLPDPRLARFGNRLGGGDSSRRQDADADADEFFFARPSSSAPADQHGSRSRNGGVGKGRVAAPPVASAGKKRPRNVEADSGDVVASAAVDSVGLEGLCGRDDFLDSLHSLGKLLYAKRGADGRLEYEPESIMASCAYDAGTTAAFLTQNAVALFLDLADLAAALDVWSASDVLLSHGGGARGRRGGSSGGGSAAYPEQEAASLVSRVISTFNRDPAPRTFRQTRKPVQFAVERIASENRRWVTAACLGLTCTDVLPRGGSIAIDSRLHVPSVAETCLYVLPVLAILASAERRLLPRGRPVQVLRIGLRVATLATAACQYGHAFIAGGASGEASSYIGTSAMDFARRSKDRFASSSGDADDYVDEAALRDSDVDGLGDDGTHLALRLGDVGLEAAQEDAVGHARGSRANVTGIAALVGLHVGQWDAYAATVGVDMLRVPLLSNLESAFSAQGRSGAMSQELKSSTTADGPVLDDDVSDISDSG